MSYFKKYMLLPEAEVQRLKRTEIKEYNPEVNVLAKQNLNIEKILSDDSLSPEDKLRHFQLAKKEFQLLYDKYIKKNFPKEIESSHISTPAAPPTVPIDEHSSIEDPVHIDANDIANLIPERFRDRAKYILERMEAQPNIASYNSSNQLVVNGNIVPGTNIIDLLKDIFQFKKSFIPAGRSAFLISLKELNVPSSYISNRSLSKYVQEPLEIQSGKGIEPPPGKRPKIHLVYH